MITLFLLVLIFPFVFYVFVRAFCFVFQLIFGAVTVLDFANKVVSRELQASVEPVNAKEPRNEKVIN